MKLYYATGTCALAPHIVAAEAGLALELERVDLGTHPRLTVSGEVYARINPKDYVPALRLDDGSLLTEGVAISLYLSSLAPQARLAPDAGTPAWYRLIEWLTFIASELHKSYSPWLFHPETGELAQRTARERIAARLPLVERHLSGRADGEHAYLVDDAFGIADAYAFTVLGWSKPAGIDLAPYPRIAQYLAHIAARAPVRTAMRAQGMATEAGA